MPNQTLLPSWLNRIKDLSYRLESFTAFIEKPAKDDQTANQQYLQSADFQEKINSTDYRVSASRDPTTTEDPPKKFHVVNFNPMRAKCQILRRNHMHVANKGYPTNTLPFYYALTTSDKVNKVNRYYFRRDYFTSVEWYHVTKFWSLIVEDTKKYPLLLYQPTFWRALYDNGWIPYSVFTILTMENQEKVGEEVELYYMSPPFLFASILNKLIVQYTNKLLEENKYNLLTNRSTEQSGGGSAFSRAIVPQTTQPATLGDAVTGLITLQNTERPVTLREKINQLATRYSTPSEELELPTPLVLLKHYAIDSLSWIPSDAPPLPLGLPMLDTDGHHVRMNCQVSSQEVILRMKNYCFADLFSDARVDDLLVPPSLPGSSSLSSPPRLGTTTEWVNQYINSLHYGNLSLLNLSFANPNVTPICSANTISILPSTSSPEEGGDTTQQLNRILRIWWSALAPMEEARNKCAMTRCEVIQALIPFFTSKWGDYLDSLGCTLCQELARAQNNESTTFQKIDASEIVDHLEKTGTETDTETKTKEKTAKDELILKCHGGEDTLQIYFEKRYRFKLADNTFRYIQWTLIIDLLENKTFVKIDELDYNDPPEDFFALIE